MEQLTEYVDTSLRQSESYFRGVLQFMESKSQQYVPKVTSTENTLGRPADHLIANTIRPRRLGEDGENQQLLLQTAYHLSIDAEDSH